MESVRLAHVRRGSAVALAATFFLVGCDVESSSDDTSSASAGAATSSRAVSSEPRHRDAGAEEPHRIDPPAGQRPYASQIFETGDGLGVSWFEGRPVAEADDDDFPDGWSGERVWSFAFAEWNGRQWTGKTEVASSPDIPGRCPTHPLIVRTGPDTYFADCFPSVGTPRLPTVVCPTDGGETWERAWRGPESLLPLGAGHQKFVEVVPLEEDVLALWQIRRPEHLKPPASKLEATLISADISAADGRPARRGRRRGRRSSRGRLVGPGTGSRTPEAACHLRARREANKPVSTPRPHPRRATRRTGRRRPDRRRCIPPCALDCHPRGPARRRLEPPRFNGRTSSLELPPLDAEV